MKTAERTIRFYRADAGLDESGSRLEFDPQPALEWVNGLPWIDESNGRYLGDGSGDRVYGCWVDDTDSWRKVRLCTSRRNDLPAIEVTGNLQPVMVPPGGGVSDQIHMVFFRDGVVGADYNHYGPRASTLAYYLMRKAGQHCPRGLAFLPLLDRDVLRRLQNLRSLRLFTLRLQASEVDVLRNHDRTLHEAMRNSARLAAGSSASVEITINAGRARWLPDEALGWVRTLASSAGALDILERFVIRGYDKATGGVEGINLLSESLVSTKRIVRQDEQSRSLLSSSAYSAIEEAYAELSGRIEVAVGAEIWASGAGGRGTS